MYKYYCGKAEDYYGPDGFEYANHAQMLRANCPDVFDKTRFIKDYSLYKDVPMSSGD